MKDGYNVDGGRHHICVIIYNTNKNSFILSLRVLSFTFQNSSPKCLESNLKLTLRFVINFYWVSPGSEVGLQFLEINRLTRVRGSEGSYNKFVSRPKGLWSLIIYCRRMMSWQHVGVLESLFKCYWYRMKLFLISHPTNQIIREYFFLFIILHHGPGTQDKPIKRFLESYHSSSI